MSTSAVIPPSSSSVERPSFARRLPRLTARARALLTAVNLHYAAVAALAILTLYLTAHLLFLFQSISATNADALAQQRVTLRAAQIAAQPLRGIDVKVANSTAQANQFYAERLPYAYSQVLAELGTLTSREHVKLSRVQYKGTPALSGEAALTEVSMDSSLSGDYTGLVKLVNALERDRMFFVINGITLTGAQGGQVNLRMRLTTYLRQPTEIEPYANEPSVGDTNPPAAAAGGAQ